MNLVGQSLIVPYRAPTDRLKSFMEISADQLHSVFLQTETREMQLVSSDWQMKLGRGRHEIYFATRGCWKWYRALVNSRRVRSPRRKRYWLGVAEKWKNR